MAANRQARGGRFSGKGVIFVQNEIDPRIGYTVLGIIAVLVIGFFIWRLRGPTFKPQTTGSEAYQREYKPKILAVARPHRLIWAEKRASRRRVRSAEVELTDSDGRSDLCGA